MKKRTISILLLVIAVRGAQAQSTIVIAKPVYARSLSGTVVDQVGGTVAGAEIKLFTCPTDWPHSRKAPDYLSTVIADSEGHFSTEQKSNAKPFCLRVSARNFQQLEVQVRTSRFAPELRLMLRVGV